MKEHQKHQCVMKQPESRRELIIVEIEIVQYLDT